MRTAARFIVTISVLTAVMTPRVAPAAEIKLMCPPPMRTTIIDLVAQFERATSNKVMIIHAPTRMIMERIEGGEAFDVAILTSGAGAALIKRDKLARRVEIAKSRMGLAVSSGTPLPDVSSVDAVKRTLLAAKSFARNEGAESGNHIVAIFNRLGIAEQMKAKTKAIPVGNGYVAELVARGEVELAAQQMPELKAVAGVDAVLLPPELQLIVVFEAGISASPNEPDAANALVTFLSSAEAGPVLKSKGLDRP